MIKVIRFTASWCGPCKSLAPIFNELQSENTIPNVTFTTIDVDQNKELTSAYHIRSVPAVVIENNGVVVQHLTGVQRKYDYEMAIQKSIFNK